MNDERTLFAPSMKFCPKCGTRFPSDARPIRQGKLVCQNCGHEEVMWTQARPQNSPPSSLPKPNHQQRPWQPKIIQRSIDAIKEKKRVIIDAPTGSGKTLIALGVVKNLISEKRFERAYIAVRTINEMVPYERDLDRFFPDISHKYILGKKRACPFYTIGDDRNSALCTACLKGKRMVVDSSEIRSESHKGLHYLEQKYVKRIAQSGLSTEHNGVCLYHSMKDMYAPLSIITYPYITNSALANLPMFDSKSIRDLLPDSLLIVDEAHNLEESGELFTDRISPRILDSAERSMEEFKHLFSEKDEFQHLMIELHKLEKGISTFYDLDGRTQHKDKEQLQKLIKNDLKNSIEKIRDASSKIEEERRELAKKGATKKVTNPLFPVTDFISGFERSYDRLELFSESGGISIKILDPADSLEILSEAGGLVLMSGTMPSKERIEKIWGLNDLEYIKLLRDYQDDYYSVFPRGNLQTKIDSTVTSKFTERNPVMWESYAAIVEKVALELGPSKKMTLVCCPSYFVAQNIFANLSESGRKNTIIETTKTRVEEITEDTKIVLGVGRGKIFEGVEFVRDESSMIGAVVIAGIPYPIPNDIHKWRSMIVMKRLQVASSGDIDFDFFMREPALIVVKQAIGRAIRFPGDRATVHLLDSRFDDTYWKRELSITDG